MPPTDSFGFAHRFLPARPQASHPVTLLLLHGTGGDENNLLGLGADLLPGAALLSLRGKVLENGMPRFFRRFAEGVFDVEDLKFRTDELAQFIEAASRRYDFTTKKLIVVGYSNGANIAASLILLHPHHLAAAVLFRAMVPFEPDIIRDFSDLSVFIGAGARDPIVPGGQPQELAALLESGGARVTLSWHAGGHELGDDDIEAARRWLSETKIRNRTAA
ncbi:MAG: alpha/beta hydrolase [Candidatus Sulfotelmatobacter sp.]